MKIKSEKGYDATISLVWETKALIYEETRHMDLKRYIEYMEKDIALLKKNSGGNIHLSRTNMH